MWGLVTVFAIGFVVYKLHQAQTSTKPTTTDPGAQCIVTRRDGPYAICLTRLRLGESTAWRWRADQVDPIVFDEDGPRPPESLTADADLRSQEEALADAWVELSRVPIGDTVVPSARTRRGLTLTTSGDLRLAPGAASESQIVNWASPRISTAAQAGDDAAGILIGVLTELYGQEWNPLRVRSDGRDFQAIVDDAAETNANPPAFARAIVRA